MAAKMNIGANLLMVGKSLNTIHLTIRFIHADNVIVRKFTVHIIMMNMIGDIL
jgi:hypothetical protein